MKETVINACDIGHKIMVLEKNTRESYVDMSQGSFKKNLNYLYNIQRIFLYLRLLIYEKISTKIN